MAKKISFTDDKIKYTLEFTRDSVKQMERNGFSISNVTSQIVTSYTELFAGAFLANHPDIEQEKIDSIYAAMPDKPKLFEKLVTMYIDVINTLTAEPEEGSKKIVWRADW